MGGGKQTAGLARKKKRAYAIEQYKLIIMLALKKPEQKTNVIIKIPRARKNTAGTTKYRGHDKKTKI